MGKYIIKTAAFALLLLIIAPARVIFASESDSTVSNDTEGIIWDEKVHTDKDGLYSYYISGDGTCARIIYYEGPWDIKKLVIPSVIDGYKVVALDDTSPDDWRGPFNYIKETVEEIIIPDSVTYIGSEAFIGLKKLKKVSLPVHLKEFSDRMFYGCESLSDIKLPEGLEIIGDSALYGTALEEVYLPDSIISIGELAFAFCSRLKEIRLPGELNVIPTGAFRNTALNKVSLPASITHIENMAFAFCKDLSKIEFHDNLSYVGWRAFDGTAWYEQRKNDDFITINDTILLAYNGSDEIPEIPADIILIADNAFKNAEITRAVIPEKVKYIGDYAFHYCRKLVTVELPDGLEAIGKYAFELTALKEIVLPDSLNRIGEAAFKDCEDLNKVSFGTQLVQLDNDVFKGTPWLEQNSGGEFVMINGSILLKYNGGSSKPVIPEGTVSIAGGAFEDKKITEMRIPDTVKYIGTHAFYNTGLKEIYFMGDAPDIGSNALTYDFIDTVGRMNMKAYYKEGAEGYDRDEWRQYKPEAYQDEAHGIEDNEDASDINLDDLYEDTNSLPEYPDDFPENSDNTDQAHNDVSITISKKNFPDKYFRTYVKRFDLNKDGMLSSEETDKVLSIYYNHIENENADDSNIIRNTISMEGISHFKRLRSIDISFSAVNVLDLSKNTRLEIIRTNGCAFSEFNISGCTMLKELYISGSTFKDLDLTNNKSLRVLECEHCRFDAIDLSANKLLNRLILTGTDMRRIDIGSLSGLEVLICDSCRINKLDISRFNKLKELDCSNNSIRYLDVSANPLLEKLSCENNYISELKLSGAGELTSLNCAGNILKELNISMNRKLIRLYCKRNKLKVLNVYSNKKLKTIETDDAVKLKGR